MKTFLQAKQDFDSKYSSKKEFTAFLPVNQKLSESYVIKNKKGETNEEYYKWQFFYSLVYSELYQKDYLGCEVYFPKGNKNSAPIKLDGAIFDDPNWFDWYKKYHKNKDQESLDWLRKHLIAVIEFKKEDSKDIETVYNQQLKPAIKESENNFCLGILYDTERLYLFQKKQNLYLRLDTNFNLKGEKSTIKDLSLHRHDNYRKIPSFKNLKEKIYQKEIKRSQRKIENLDKITGIFSKQIEDSIADILHTLDKVSLMNQRGYEILIQMIALKIFDEKKNEWLEYYIENKEHQDIKKLRFYINSEERDYRTLNDKNVQNFIKRIKNLKKNAETTYKEILSESIIDDKNEAHVRVIAAIVNSLQDYSFTRSSKSDLWQIVFYQFANAFIKSEKGQFLTPIPIIEFLVDIINPQDGETIIDPTSGSADFLSMAYIKSNSEMNDKNIYGVDNDEQMIMLAQLNMLLNGDGRSILKFQSGAGSITHKFTTDNELIPLISQQHKNGNWDNWHDYTKLKKFNIVLTNPPFGEKRPLKPKTQAEKEQAEMYELWNIARCGDWIDMGIIFLENAYRILEDNGRMGIVVSNSIASIDRWNKAREWFMKKMRIVALFDLPANVFGETGVNTTLIISYKPKEKELKKLQEANYQIFVRDIKKIGYEIRTVNRVKKFNPLFKINEKTFEIETNNEGEDLLDEEFTQTTKDFKEWCNDPKQETSVRDLFIKDK